MFLTEKSEENRQLERFYGNISLVKVVQNVWELRQGDSSVVIDRDPPFLMPYMTLLRQVILDNF